MLNEGFPGVKTEEVETGGRRTNADYRDEAMRRMMDTAIRLVAERGASRLSLVDVGREAGYSHSLPNYYFKSKKQLLLSLYRHIILRAGDLMLAWAREHLPGRLRPGLSNIRGIIRAYLGVVGAEIPSTRAMNILWSEAISSMPELLEAVRPQNSEFINFFESQLKIGIQRGEIDPEIDTRSIALIVGGILRGGAAQYMADPEYVDLQKLSDAIIFMLDKSIVMPGHK